MRPTVSFLLLIPAAYLALASPALADDGGDSFWNLLVPGIIILGVIVRATGGLKAWGPMLGRGARALTQWSQARRAEQEAVMNDAPPRPAANDPAANAPSGPAPPAPLAPRQTAAPSSAPIVEQIGRGPAPQDGIVSGPEGFRWPFTRS